MRRSCPNCGLVYNDIYRWTFCPHDGFESSPSARASLEADGIPADEPASERPVLADAAFCENALAAIKKIEQL